jgi:hypothetical protein
MVRHSVRAILFSKVPSRALDDIQVTIDLMVGEQTLTKKRHCRNQPCPWTLMDPDFWPVLYATLTLSTCAIMVASYKKFQHRKIIQFRF